MQEMKIVRKGKTVKVKYPENQGYDYPNETALKVKEYKDGYLVKSKAVYQTAPAKVFNLDYAEAEYLFLALKELFETNEEQANSWIKVPRYWKAWRCPDSSITDECEIEVHFRNGEITSDFAREYQTCWSQDNNQYDIVKYRKL